MFRENNLKKLLNSGGKALGCWTSMDSPITTEILAEAGFDFLLIDHEHGYGDSKGLAVQLQAMAGTNTSSLLRVPELDQTYIKRVMDTGIEAIMIPGINSAEEARRAISYIMYPPKGVRGLAPGMIRGSRYGIDAAEYVETVNDNLFVICQIESPEAVGNIDAIAAVDGVDMLFIGPNDLSASIGKFWQFDDAEVKELIEGAEQKILATGKLWGTIPYGGLGWQDLFNRGCALTTAGSEVAMLKNAATAIVQQHAANNRTNRAAE